MTQKLYKYGGPRLLQLAFSSKEHCTFRFSPPRDFNDPYELFLTIDYRQDPEVLAYYSDLIGEIPHHPTSCFSKSPDVVPLWAHYGHGHRGLVIEVDEEKLATYVKDINFGDVDYKPGPDDRVLQMVRHAMITKKFRHAIWAQNTVNSAAYYTKHDAWRYEMERRAVVPPEAARIEGDILVVSFPLECVTGLIAGARATDEIKAELKTLAERIGANYLETRIGRAAASPFFVSSSGQPLSFVDGRFKDLGAGCESCGEPSVEGASHCVWCRIEDTHREDAARANSLRVLEREGFLADYQKFHRDVREGGKTE